MKYFIGLVLVMVSWTLSAQTNYSILQQRRAVAGTTTGTTTKPIPTWFINTNAANNSLVISNSFGGSWTFYTNNNFEQAGNVRVSSETNTGTYVGIGAISTSSGIAVGAGQSFADSSRGSFRYSASGQITFNGATINSSTHFVANNTTLPTAAAIGANNGAITVSNKDLWYSFSADGASKTDTRIFPAP